jgi:hypothetical protein
MTDAELSELKEALHDVGGPSGPRLIAARSFLSDAGPRIIAELNASRRRRALLERVLAANIVQGCKPDHPRVALVYEIQAALAP